MQTRTVIADPIPEQSSFRLAAQLQDENGAGIAIGSLTTLTLTLYNSPAGGPINSRSEQNVLNANGVSVDGTGNLVWAGIPADSVMLGTDQKEWRIALFRWTFNVGLKGGSHEILFPVINRVKVL